MSYDNINQYDQQQQQQLTYLLDDNMNMTNILYDSQSSNSIFGDNITNTVNPTTTMMGQKFSTKVAVKSSAHVSYIVGKQGSKIRQIRQETGTFIQTPVNGEEPIFVISGDKDSVQLAKNKLEEAANEFDFNIFVEACTFKDGDRIRNNLFLPARYIGLVVGKKGSIIKRIMESSDTTIVTPKVNTLNGFKIHGKVEKIRLAIDMIKEHILSTSNVIIDEIQQNQFEITLQIKECYQ
ncbi:K y RNA-binding domain [Dermatophagoides pteronyssinus]|uniref:K y RNA-binding domain n=1 Tax=Dermatophagoides pteronyssinus TaxID=6956 RepID=A0ABQ8JMS6_DERPT|nr:K y RNA-binding domain [Dermatophagoides pteronyssinus]